MAKILLPLATLFVFLFSCSRESSEPPWEPGSNLGSKNYNGGLFPVWITLKDPITNENIENRIRWRTGSSIIAYRTQAIDTAKNQVTADTAFLYWDSPPQPTVKIDSMQITSDSISSWKLDTAYLYIDTIFAIIDGLESLPIIIEVKNILPRISKITIGGVDKPGDSILTIAAHPGETIEISLYLQKSFNQAFNPIVTMPQKMGNLRLKTRSDSLWVYDWTVPNDTIADSSEYLKIEDSGGYGERLYKVYLIVYTESGSVWVASQNEIVKYSSYGAEVARISDSFSNISDISINSENKRLHVTDVEKNTFSIYDTYGNRLYKSDSLFNSPSSVAVDVGGYIWVADAIDALSAEFDSQLRRFRFNGSSLEYSNLIYEMSGEIKGLSVDQYQEDFVWFAIPKKNNVGFVIGENPPKYITIANNEWKRPSMVSHDPTGLTWIADSSRVVAIDTNGNVKANITGFGYVSSVSASGGNVWVSDVLAGEVYHFKGPFNGTDLQKSLTDMYGTKVEDVSFLSPVSVSAIVADGGAWVIDEGRGIAVHLDSSGKQIAFGTGLVFPKLGKTLQKVE